MHKDFTWQKHTVQPYTDTGGQEEEISVSMEPQIEKQLKREKTHLVYLSVILGLGYSVKETLG